MDMLKLALEARLPFIHVTTDDILHVREILTHLVNGAPVKGFEGGEEPELSGADYYFVSTDGVATGKLYRIMKTANKTLVFVNTKTSVLHFHGGTMLPPKEMILVELKKHTSPENAEEILTAFGGMTLKDTFEVIRLTLERDGKLTATGCNRTRQSYVSKLKGIQQVDSDYDFYNVPSYLQDWCDLNLEFFKNPVHASLTPRGLLFDGPPGTGKTMGAKFLSQQLGVPLYRLDVGAMKGKYVGDSEGNLNAALTQIDQAAPCVVLMDEIEKVFSTQSNEGTGVTTSMLGAILWWMQEHKSKVFVVMTTNRASIIPPELHREGRIDATLTFNGLQSIADAEQFAASVINHLRPSVPAIKDKDVDKVRQSVGNKLSILFDGKNAVPQVKVTEEVNKAIKAVLVGKKESK